MFDDWNNQPGGQSASGIDNHISRVPLEKRDENWLWPACAGNGTFDGFKRHSRALQQTAILHGATSVSLEVASSGTSSTLNFIFMLEGALDLIDVKNRRMQILKANDATGVVNHPDIRARFHPGSAWVAYRVPMTTLRRHYEQLMHGPYLQDTAFAPLYEFRAGGASALYQALCYVSDDISAISSSMREIFTEVYENLLLAKLILMRPDDPHAIYKSLAPRIVPRPILRADTFMRENIRASITLVQIARAAGCSPRALQRVFKEHLGKSPMQILSDYRLSGAHEAIMSGNARNVIDLAIAFQFSNPGRFSALYRNAYGESPAAMMRFRQKNV
jgi:AraC-like DNA-binding protein